MTMTLLLRGDSSIHIPYISRAQWAIGCDDFQAYMDIVEEFLELGKDVTCLAWNTLIYDMCFSLEPVSVSLEPISFSLEPQQRPMRCHFSHSAFFSSQPRSVSPH